MSKAKKTLLTKQKKKLFSAFLPFFLKLRNCTQFTGKLAIKFVVFVLKILEVIGKTAILFGKVVFKIIGSYLKRVKRTFFRLALLIQFIGEVALLVAFTVSLITRRLLEQAGILSRPKKKSRLVIILAKSTRKIKKINLNKAFNNFLESARNFRFRKPPRYALVTALTIFLLWGVYYYSFLKDLPSPYNLEKNPLPQSSLITDKNGKLLYVAYNGKINRIPVSFDKIPAQVKQATVAVEDEDFYKHDGVSLKGISRALVNNIRHKSTQGGSTITQQLVKIALLKDTRRVISRKVKEAYLALLVERAYPKNKILEMYLNNAPYGGTAYGIEAAARKYFGKETTQLTLSEAALLASLPSAPTLYSPYSTEAKVYKRNQKHVLEQMIKIKYISKQQGQSSYNEKLAFYSIENQIFAPHFVFWVMDQLEHEYGKQAIQEEGLLIATTLDLATQLKAEQIVKENVEELEKPYWISNASALVTEPKTGRILAMVGSRDYFDDEHQGKVNVTVMKRQPGSSIKVVNYSYALSKGGFTPSSIISDSPVTYSNAWESYSPKNYDGKYRGNVTVKQALAMSLNVPAVKVLNTYGADKMVELGIKMGIDSWKDLKNYGLSLTLGAGEVKMTELATVYATFPNLGRRKDLYAVEKISDRNGKLLADAQNPQKGVLGVSTVQAASEESVIPEYTAYQITSILSDNAARMPAFGPYAKLEVPGHKVAVKTGTTNDIRDNWTIGYTPDVLVATWVGNNDNKPMNPHLTSGITGAAPIWNEIMSGLLADKPQEQYATPSGMVKVKICAVNGLLTCPRCPKEAEEFFAPGQEPKTKCYFPTSEECKAKKDQMTAENKSPDEVNKALVNCPAGSTN